MILIVASNKDAASLNIVGKILEHHSFRRTGRTFEDNPVCVADVGNKRVELITLDQESIYAQRLADFRPEPELIIFVSRHSSLSRTPTLSVHTPGNLGEAEFGGLLRRVSFSPANAMRDVLKAMICLKEEFRLDYEVSYECTHHGPSLDVPAMFSELGSSPEQWNDVRAAEAVALATMQAVGNFGKSHAPAMLGIGGPHYSEKFSQMALTGEVAFGHMIPKYALPYVDSQILRQCVERTLERVDSAVLDWKGIKSEHKLPLVKMLGESGLSFEKV